MQSTSIKKIAFVAMIVLTMALIGCRTSPVFNVTDAPINASGKVTSNDVKKLFWRLAPVLGGK